MLELRSREGESLRLRARSPRILILIGLVVLAVVGAGVLLVTASSGSDDIEVATDLVDEWHAAWNDNDPEAMAAVFTEDGVYALPPDSHRVDAVGHRAIVWHAEYFAPGVTDLHRTSDLVATDADNTYRFTARWMMDGDTVEGEGEVVMDGELASRIAWLSIAELD